MAYISLPADRGSSHGVFARIAAFFAAVQSADRRLGYGEPFGL